MGVGGVGMNKTACSALIDGVPWGDPVRICLLVLLYLVDVMVVAGNVLVILAVCMSSKLQSVTNFFIVSLAVADLLVGLVVLPFSATWEVFKVWIFGDILCSVWLATDVWMCTASILNLCAISLDRYLAVTRPVTYPSIMSVGRAKILICAVWLLSFLICFPPLVGWKEKNPPLDGEVIEPECPWRCELTNERGYVIYSALGSFYIPMLVMLFFYWRIYKAAIHTTKAINQGFRTTKSTRAFGNRFDEQRLTLRIHRGKGSVMRGSSGSNSTTNSAANSGGTSAANSTVNSAGNSVVNSTVNSVVNSTTNSPGPAKSPRKDRKYERIKISVSLPSNEAISSAVNNNEEPPEPSPPSPTPTTSKENSQEREREEENARRKDTLKVSQQRRPRRSNSESVPPRPELLADSAASTSQKDLSPSPTFEENHKSKFISKMGKRNIKAQVKRFRMETKAAKTLGIIVGGFIFCWLPFFSMYLLRAFCESCINPTVFSVFFWLGYSNSAINPCIYALFSKDFRFAFKKIICKCLCSPEPVRRPSSRYRRRGSDGSTLGLRRSDQRSRSASINNNEQGHLHSDSDPANDHVTADSR